MVKLDINKTKSYITQALFAIIATGEIYLRVIEYINIHSVEILLHNAKSFFANPK